MKLFRTVLAITLCLAPAALADDVIVKGADVWHTVTGYSHTHFGADPIPADFFCKGSAPFAGKVVLKGAPIASEPPGVLGTADTIVHRLDNARFDRDGVARTRLQVLAMSLTGVEPVEVPGCGLYDVAVTLAGEQPITEMKIKREAADGGTYAAPLSLETRVAFTPVGGGMTLDLFRRIDLGPGINTSWSTTDMFGSVDGRPVKVDGDGDGVAETVLPGRSNFRAGVRPANFQQQPSPQPQPRECFTTCHCTPWEQNPEPNEPNDFCQHLHCTEITPSGQPCGPIFEQQ